VAVLAGKVVLESTPQYPCCKVNTLHCSFKDGECMQDTIHPLVQGNKEIESHYETGVFVCGGP